MSGTAEARVQFRDLEQVRSLLGVQDRNLRRFRDALNVDVVVRGDELVVQGESEPVSRGAGILSELRGILDRQGSVPDDEFDRVLFRAQFESDSSDAGIDILHKGRKVTPMSPGQRGYVEAMRTHDLVFCGGPAGSGKTYLAVAMAVHALRRELVRKIVLVRPAVEAGEKLGFLPGDMFAKVNPYLRPLLDALGDLLDFDTVQRYLERDVVEILPMAFMRGRTLNHTFIILDEAQNTTITQMKMFLTRMGNYSKIVVTGDTTQIDLPESVPSGLIDALQRLEKVPGVAVTRLLGDDIVRHPLVRRIVAAYDDELPKTAEGGNGAARVRTERTTKPAVETSSKPDATTEQGSPDSP